MAQFKSGGKGINKFRPKKDLNNANDIPNTVTILLDQPAFRSRLKNGGKSINKFRPSNIINNANEAPNAPPPPNFAPLMFRPNFSGINKFRPKKSLAPTPEGSIVRFSQENLEIWTKLNNPEVRFSQVNLEVWTLADDKLRRLVNVYLL